MPRCLSCQRGFLDECDYDIEGGCKDESNSTTGAEVEGEGSETEEDERDSGERTRRYKSDAALKDQQSTGRKRAAKLYPLDRNAPCMWRGKENCGGGANPIKGCVDGLQQARHHGPDYSTLNNDPENVNNICHSCHNRYHAANDPYKGEAYLKQYGHIPKKLGKQSLLQEFLAGINDSPTESEL
jgi:hypothetical protein